MDLIPFYDVEPELADRETRTITVLVTQDDLPEETYALVEAYCPDPACDCRRVMLNVVSQERLQRGYLASISYAFDRDDEMAGPYLDPLNPQSEYAETLLQSVTDSVLRDPAYLQRLERHYELVKQAASDLTHPAYGKMRRGQPSKERVARNAPCPCGSGKKYKQCCMWKDRWAT